MTDASPNATCPACAQSFECGMVAGSAACWCFQLPHSLPVPSASLMGGNSPATGCFCRACLPLRLNVPTPTNCNQLAPALTDPDGPP